MRTLLLMLLTVVVIAGLGGIYVWLQPATRRAAMQSQATPAPAATRPAITRRPATTDENAPVVQSGTDVWVKVPDASGALAWQFKASRIDPQPDNTVNVTDPRAEFFLKDGQIIGLEGSHGRVYVPGDAAKDPNLRGASAPPSRGEMYDVTISLYQANNPQHAVLVAKVNNVSFDNDTFRIATEQIRMPDGTVVPADQVPVQVRGDQYDFDGKGMTIRWNDRDRRLELLEIAHGHSFTIKDQPAAAAAPAAPRSARGGEPRPRRPGTQPAVQRPVETVASGDETDATTEPTTRKSQEQQAYRATFEGGVTVTQQDKQVAKAETMKVDFRMEDDTSGAGIPAGAARSGGASPPAPRSGARAGATTRRARRPASIVPIANNSSGAPTGPTVIHWPGRLVVVPIEDGAPGLLAGHQIVEMISKDSTVVLNQNGGELTCGSFVYSDADNSLTVRNSPMVPLITMKDAGGAILHTPSLVYDASSSLATLTGASSAQIPVQAEQQESVQMLNASWTRSCVLKLVGQSQEQMTIESAQMDGQVKIDHPQIKLQSDSLTTTFAQVPASAPDKKAGVVPKQMVATGSVICDLTDEQQATQHVTSDSLTLETTKTADERIVPQRVRFDGNVHAFSDEQDLRAGQMDLTVAPTTRPSDPIRIERMFAQNDVRFTTKEASGQSDQLDATIQADDDTQLKLLGSPASLKNGNTTLVGRQIRIGQKQQSLEVSGEGTMSGVQQETPQSKPVPFTVSWSKQLNFDGAHDQGNVSGDVVVKTVSSDGTQETMSGDQLLLTLMDEPATTKPASRPHRATSGPSTRPGSSFAAGFGSMQQKTLRTLDLNGNVEVKSVLNSAAGAPLQRMNLFSQAVHVDAGGKRLVVPVEGRMLVEDRSAATQPSTQPATQPGTALAQASTAPAPVTLPASPTTKPASPLGSMSGATAFQWQKQLIYDRATNQAELTGDVVIVHQDNDQASLPFRIEAPRVAAQFQDVPADESRKAKQPEPGQSERSSIKLSRLTADGGVRFISPQIQFDGAEMIFDPTINTLIARGNDDSPGQIYDEHGVSTGTFRQATWNTLTQQLTLSDFQALIRK